ncbi:anaerobic benzoate catabolism transcriptional regulator [Oxobacter pfennigii]|uniref:Anaerobic benzoate catabolism transcriptional regulator n=1 Tax=Oxobacter pfennigii TaxID=36849 RepID=A0A0P8Y816_9CLOT|nr:helix-turn-helix transcriptional regulator [Oxobacter pfennigii]KPU42767.1 anaerobic benzoate catabolism transcriptional regulator [Oxobacter pfennigii]
MNDIVKLVGERIRNLRNERNWSQEELAHRANMHRSHLGEIERGETSVTVESIAKIAGAFEMTLEEVFKHLQPSFENKDNTTLTLLMNRINNLSTDNQKTMLDLIDLLQHWKA